MEYTTLLADVKGHQKPSQRERKSLQMVCQEIGDGRAARGKRYDLAGLLLVLVLAKMAGINSVLGASEWIKHHEATLREELHLCWKEMPCANTYRYALAHLKSQEVNGQFAAWCTRQEKLRRSVEQCQQQRSELGHLAIDGFAINGTGTQTYGGDDPQKHLLHLYEVATGIVLEQIPIATKNNEVSALKPLLTEVICKGRILTSDAAQSYHEYGRLVKRAGGDVIVIVKDNTPVTRVDLELFFEDPEADRSTWHSYDLVEKGHGRLERRWIQTSPDLNDFLARDWGEVGQVFRLQRERTIKGKKSIEVIYGWTSLSPQRCSPQRLLAFIRAHWAVENRLHWRRDTILEEDRCGVRLEAVAEMLAVLNTLVLFLMDVHHIKNVASQLRRFSARPQEACAWVVA